MSTTPFRWTVLALALFACTTTLAFAQTTKVLLVDKDATGAEDGSSWEDAYTTLQDALTAAPVQGYDRTQIWVKKGDYYPDEGSA